MLHDSLLFFVIYRLNCVPLIDMSTCTVFWSRHYFRSRRDEMYMDVTQYSPLDVYKLYKTTEWRTLSIYWQEPQLPISWHNNTGHTKNVNELIDNINRTAYHWHVPYHTKCTFHLVIHAKFCCNFCPVDRSLGSVPYLRRYYAQRKLCSGISINKNVALILKDLNILSGTL